MRDGRVVSALQKLPYPLTYGGRMLPASYISGACTDENYRKRGLMGELLAQTHRAMQGENAVLSFLIPATAELATYYAKFGYTPCFRFGWKEAHPNPPCEGGGTDLTVREVLPHREDLSGSELLIYLRDKMQERPWCVQHPLSDLYAVVDDMRMAGDAMWEVRRGTLLVGLAICRAEADGVLLRECVYNDEAAREALIAAIATHHGKTEVDVLDTTGREGDYFGMARVINAEAMLVAYATQHPELDLKINVTDDELSGNNGCYHINGGVCVRLSEAADDAEPLTIAQLTHKVLTEENPLMSLMMND